VAQYVNNHKMYCSCRVIFKNSRTSLYIIITNNIFTMRVLLLTRIHEHNKEMNINN